jgi:hypothetical protein
MRLYALLAAATAVLACTATPATAAGGTAYTWVGSSQNAAADNHSWTDARNWSPQGVPGDGDSVVVTEPDAAHCTAHVDAVPTVTLTDFSLTSTRCSSSINGGAITVTGTFSWDGGTLNTPTRINGSGTLAGTNSHLNVLSADLAVAGSLTLSGLTDSGASNQGGFRMVNPYTLHILSGGTLISSGPNAVQFLSCCLDPARIVNDGTLSMQSGALTVRAVEIDQHGQLTASDGARLISVGDPIRTADGARYTGSGGWQIVDGSKAKFAGTQTTGSGFHLELGGLQIDAGAELGGTATLAGGGVFDWTGGTIEGNLTIAHGMRMRASGAHTGNGRRVLYGQDGLSGGAAAVVTNHGSMRFDGGAGVLTGYQARLVNAADGTLAVADGTDFNTISCCLYQSAVINYGTAAVSRSGSAASVLFDGVAYKQRAGTTTLGSGARLDIASGTGSMSLLGGAAAGTGTVGGGIADTGATVRPAGAAIGTLHVAGSYTQGLHAKLALDLAARSHDVLAVTGAASLGGTLTAHNAGTYHPRPGVKYRVLAAGSLAYHVSCVVTSGAGSSSGHWGNTQEGRGVSFVWRAGPHTRC